MSTPFFIVSSGRSGTAMLTKVLAATPGITIEHEYMVHIVQPLAVRRYRGLVDAEESRHILASTHGAALTYAQTRLWGDSSNKLSWLIPDLAALFPDARFIHLVRDGRKVASSYFHKLGGECYDDRSASVLAAYLSNPERTPAPPPEKKYWWPQPQPHDPWAEEFGQFDQFQRIAWHWAEVNRVIARDLADVPAHRRLFVRLEDLRAQRAEVARLFAFLDCSFSASAFDSFARPHNVNRPVDHLLTALQADQFAAICGPVMESMGYADRAEYAVNY